MCVSEQLRKKVEMRVRKKENVCQYVWSVHSVLKWQQPIIPAVVCVINVNKINIIISIIFNKDEPIFNLYSEQIVL